MLKIKLLPPPSHHHTHSTNHSTQHVSHTYAYPHDGKVISNTLFAQRLFTQSKKLQSEIPQSTSSIPNRFFSHLKHKNSKAKPKLPASKQGVSFIKSIDSPLLFALALLFIFASMLYLNISTPLIADDYDYAFSGSQKVSSFSQIFEAMYKHYFEWGGRIVVHSLAMFFLWQPHVVFTVLNAFVFTLLIYLLCAHASVLSGKIARWPLVLFAFAVVSCFAPRFGQDVLWLTGSCNYLWGNTLVLATLLPFTRRVCGQKSLDRSLIGAFILSCFAFIAGWTTEGGGATLIATQFLMIITVYVREKKISLWMVSAWIASLGGFLFMILAPGNFKRLAVDGDGIHVLRMFFKILGSYFEPSFLLYPLIMMLFLMQLPVFKQATIRKATILAVLILLSSTFCFVLSPFYTGRVYFLPICIMTIMLMIPLYCQKVDDVKQNGFYKCCGVLLLAISLQVIYFAGHDARHVKTFYATVEKMITTAQEQNSTGDILIPASICYEPVSHFAPSYRLATLSSDPDGQINQLMAKYYDTEQKIRVVVEKYPLK